MRKTSTSNVDERVNQLNMEKQMINFTTYMDLFPTIMTIWIYTTPFYPMTKSE